MKTPRTAWQKIRDASIRGTGTPLTADDVRQLASDSAIMVRAEMDAYDADADDDDDDGVARTP